MRCGFVAVLLATTVLMPPALGADGDDVPVGFRTLFNGADLEGWWGVGTEDPRAWMALDADALSQRRADSQADIAAHWRAEDGALINDGGGLYLTTVEHFGDFELRLRYATVAGADSGVYLRGCPQVQIWDTTEAGGKWNIGADKGSGGLWNNNAGSLGKDPLVHADRPFGMWNELRIIMIGERVTIDLNGRRVVDHARMHNYFDRALPILARGPIQLQTHGGEIRWRDIHVRDIGADEANARLAMAGASGFTSVFNGIDFTGWSGPTDSYEVVDGSLRCRKGTGGTIYTDEQYDDFVARFEFRLPPGGNNGLAIRYPGAGDAAYKAMCELQVLDSTHPKYANLDKRQYHGSAYGMAAAHRGYLRPPGQWNFQQVTVRGARITVELNGTQILDEDLKLVTDFMYDQAKFEGRLRTNGHFGFAGHNDPVAFRRVALRRLTPVVPE